MKVFGYEKFPPPDIPFIQPQDSPLSYSILTHSFNIYWLSIMWHKLYMALDL